MFKILNSSLRIFILSLSISVTATGWLFIYGPKSLNAYSSYLPSLYTYNDYTGYTPIDWNTALYTHYTYSGYTSYSNVCDINGDGQMGLQEVVHILRIMAGIQD